MDDGEDSTELSSGLALGEGPTERAQGRVSQVIDTTFVLLLPAISAGFLWASTQVRSPTTHQLSVTPRTFPLYVGLGLLLTSSLAVAEHFKPQLVSFVSGIRGRGTETRPHDAGEGPTKESDAVGEESRWWAQTESMPDLFVTLIAILMLVALFGPLGFLGSVFLTMVPLSIYFDRKHWLRNTFIVAVLSLSVLYLFNSLLGISLPTGVGPDIFG